MNNQNVIRCIGIDPGTRGAVAVIKLNLWGEVVYIDHLPMPLRCRNNHVSFKDYREMESFKRKQKKGRTKKLATHEKVRPFPDEQPIIDFIRSHGGESVMLEKAFDGGMNRVKGAATIMNSYGGLLATARMATDGMVSEVAPRTWQAKMLKLDKNSDTKTLAIDFCVNMLLFDVPKTSNLSTAKPHDGISDAVVLACYGAVEHFGRHSIGKWLAPS